MLTLDKVYQVAFALKNVVRPTNLIAASGLSNDCNVYLKPENLQITGAGRGVSIGHVCPEAADGGPIGLVYEGDQIEIDIPNAKITLLVSNEELKNRRKELVLPEPNIKTGWLSRYASQVSGANFGAIMK